MATKTFGSLATTTLTAVQFSPDATTLSEADLATVAQGIYNQDVLARSFVKRGVPGAFSRSGVLYIPERGYLKLFAGDWVAIDPFTGWPLLFPQSVVPKTLTATGTTNSTTAVTFASSVIALGWARGLHITDASGDIPASTSIADISADGLTVTLSAAATGSHSGNVCTVGSFTHS